MKYAVIRSGNKQYTVYENSVIEVDRLGKNKDDMVEFADVLLVVSDGSRTVGTPIVANAVVSGKVLDEVKGDKIRVSKFKSKVRFRRVTGFRAKKTRVMVEKIEVSGSQKEKTQPKQEEQLAKKSRTAKK
jgi:large subunit ribosomal protein L21